MGNSTLTELRALRRGKRIAEQEWFELAYRAYLAGLCWFAGAAALSAVVGDEPFTPEQRADVLAYAPGVVGLIAAVVIALGLRAGARGGPLSVEAADVHHVLLAPLPRAAVLRRPAVQQVRTALLSGMAAGALCGSLLARRMEEPMAPWITTTALAGAAIAIGYVAVALVAHALRLRGWQATVLGLALVAWQVASIPNGSEVPGPFDGDGRIVLWPEQFGWSGLGFLVAIVAMAGLGLAVLERLSLEALDRRSALVSQLRFAVTMRDLRTVVLLRRQLMNEQHRNRAWIKLPRRTRFTVARRDVRGFARLPAARIGRITALCAIAAVAQVAAYRGTTPAVLVSGLAAFVVGLELLEPFAQELDHPDLGALVPKTNGWVMVRHLPVSGVLAIVLALATGVVTAAAMGAGSDEWVLTLVLALAVAIGGLSGAVLNTIGGAPSEISAGSVSDLLPPEIAGFREGLRTLWPLIVATAGSLPVLIARNVAEEGREPLPPSVQSLVAVGLIGGAVAWWSGHRETVRAKFRELWAAGDAEFTARHGGAR